ncbi:MAG: acyl-CoA dehydrogenase family protein, partial [Pseudomonadota bacterium]
MPTHSDQPAILPSRQRETTDRAANMPPELPEANLFSGDTILCAASAREDLGWLRDRATALGAFTGSASARELARLANQEAPVLRGSDTDEARPGLVDYHPAYHELLAHTYRTETHALPWISDAPQAQTARSILFYLWNELENGIVGCANLMSYAAVPLLRSDAAIGERWLPGVLSSQYDSRPLPPADKSGLTVAMAMTEQQSGSDVRANTTRALPTGAEREYLLTGRKHFLSAPMSDLILMTAQTTEGVSLFVVPRVRPDGTRNHVDLQRLKDKLGNRSNATAEAELQDALGYRIGEPGQGVRSFIQHMTHYIRMGLATGSAGIMRQAFNQALHFGRHRSAFGKPVAEHAQMANVLADLAIESEAALLLGLRVARATDAADHNQREAALNRILVPVAKYWNCRRAGAVTLEAMECHGGAGYVDDHPIGRLYREAPLNSIWEGTSAMMGLDMLRALDRSSACREALFVELDVARGADRAFDQYVGALASELDQAAADPLPHARRLMTMIALAVQGSLLLRQSEATVSDGFCASRLGGRYAHELGTLAMAGAPLQTIIDRAAIGEGARPHST